ncbi:hypothetical protein JCM6882_002827 [Rhodosporidiobolus microsporus]
MLDRLPPEIIDLVLDQVGKRPSFFNEEVERRRTLYACCLVSKVLGQRAQAKLWESLEVDDEVVERIAALLGGDDNEELSHSVRVLIMDLTSTARLTGAILNVLCRLPTLEEVHLEIPLDSQEGVSVGDWHVFARLSMFLDQLDLVLVDCFYPDDFPPSLHSSSTAVLCHFHFGPDPQESPLNEFLRHPPHHLGISDAVISPWVLDHIRTLVTSTSKPISLHLPTHLHSSISPVVICAAAFLELSCSQHNVEIVWYEKDKRKEAPTSEFRAYARKFKAKARAADAAVAVVAASGGART